MPYFQMIKMCFLTTDEYVIQ